MSHSELVTFQILNHHMWPSYWIVNFQTNRSETVWLMIPLSMHSNVFWALTMADVDQGLRLLGCWWYKVLYGVFSWVSGAVIRIRLWWTFDCRPIQARSIFPGTWKVSCAWYLFNISLMVGHVNDKQQPSMKLGFETERCNGRLKI